MSAPAPLSKSDKPRAQFRRRHVYFAFAFEAGLAVIAWGLGLLVKQSPFSSLAFSLAGFLWGLLLTMPMVIGFFVLKKSTWAPMVRVRTLFDEIGAPFFRSFTRIDLAIVSILAGIGEEALFRGIIQPAIAHWLGALIGLIAASVLFGLVHAITPTYALLAALAGVYLGSVWLATSNLLVVIIIHALYDFIALTVLITDSNKRAQSRALEARAASPESMPADLDPTA